MKTPSQKRHANSILIHPTEKQFHYKGDDKRKSPASNHPGLIGFMDAVERGNVLVEGVRNRKKLLNK